MFGARYAHRKGRNASDVHWMLPLLRYVDSSEEANVGPPLGNVLNGCVTWSRQRRVGGNEAQVADNRRL